MTGNVRWTKETIHAEALKYDNRVSFRNHAPAPFAGAESRNILDYVCSHMKAKRTVWTKELVQAEALKYDTRGKFIEGSGSAYNYARRNNILDDICSHMENVYNYWTKETIHAEALKYNSRVDFKDSAYGAYQSALERHIIDEVCSHMAQSVSGYDKSKQGSIYLITIDDDYLGYGITGNLDERLARHKRNLDNAGRTHTLFASATFEDGSIPLEIEQKIKDKFVQIDLEVDGFRTEATNKKHLDDILDIIHEYQK